MLSVFGGKSLPWRRYLSCIYVKLYLAIKEKLKVWQMGMPGQATPGLEKIFFNKLLLIPHLQLLMGNSFNSLYALYPFVR